MNRLARLVTVTLLMGSATVSMAQALIPENGAVIPAPSDNMPTPTIAEVKAIPAPVLPKDLAAFSAEWNSIPESDRAGAKKAALAHIDAWLAKEGCADPSILDRALIATHIEAWVAKEKSFSTWVARESSCAPSLSSAWALAHLAKNNQAFPKGWETRWLKEQGMGQFLAMNVLKHKSKVAADAVRQWVVNAPAPELSVLFRMGGSLPGLDNEELLKAVEDRLVASLDGYPPLEKATPLTQRLKDPKSATPVETTIEEPITAYLAWTGGWGFGQPGTKHRPQKLLAALDQAGRPLMLRSLVALDSCSAGLTTDEQAKANLVKIGWPQDQVPANLPCSKPKSPAAVPAPPTSIPPTSASPVPNAPPPPEKSKPATGGGQA
jgi:hypothetical protein